MNSDGGRMNTSDRRRLFTAGALAALTDSVPRAIGESRGSQVRSVVTEPVTSAAMRPLVGRNDPCPCGSGRKYKRCCISLRGDAPC